MTIRRIECGRRMSQAVVFNGLVYLAGQVASEEANETTVAGQTRLALAEIDRLLAAAGSSKAHILSASIWLANIDTFSEMNSVWDAWVAPGAAPARATVEARLAGPEYLVEIAVVAAVSA
ncbi:enamine deaminase RidA (YjgF/YER057c/UK114 family) [Povalibacter uvarum]|uniref:Enamine deaminase RidA (YjgF/YER057c/UK114 family) n=1 Tax=Povalibacter uvarum TaxID=732238 RepID=A0A841HH07_9GAMM|nr:RidA family protein [Povalibacter uvarum]MBB6092421.1 enamine deaminase RidA (YjgF/YER057c/UK114 family) [Povalibacter uvarum]